MLAATLLVVWLLEAAPTGLGRPVDAHAAAAIDANVSSKPFGRPMPQAFVGLSIELPALTAYAGTDPAAPDPVFVELVRQLSGGGRPWLRIGGRSADAAWMPAPGLGQRSPALRFRLTTRWLEVAHGVAAALHAELLLGVNMAAGDPALARAEATAMRSTIGSEHIAAFEIGNEPDVYNYYPWYRPPHAPPLFARSASYGLLDYLREFAQWRQALAPLPVAGPAFASYTWMAHLAQFLKAEPGLALVTFHQYPLWACQRNRTAPNFASIPNLLKRSSSRGLARQIAPFAALAHAAGLLFRLDELNSAACTGQLGVSNTFAATLWSLDALFSLAAAGVDGVNIHTLPRAAYAPFTFSHRDGHWTGSVRPLYYGLLAFVRAFPPGARLLRTHAAQGPLRMWATIAPDGRVRVMLINVRSSGTVVVHLRLAGASAPLTQQALRAPSLAATSGVSLGGESFGARTRTGILPAETTPVSPILPSPVGYYRVLVPAASALLLTR
jgi:hypothetical protein